MINGIISIEIIPYILYAVKMHLVHLLSLYQNYASCTVQPLGIPSCPVVQLAFTFLTNVPVGDTPYNQ